MGTEKKEGKVVTFFKNQKGTIIAITIAITVLLIVYPKKETVVVEVEKTPIHSEKASTKKVTATAAVVTVAEVSQQSGFKRGLWIVNKSGENIKLFARVPVKGRVGEFKEIPVCVLGSSERKFFPAIKGNILSFVVKRGTFLNKNIFLGYNFTNEYQVATATVLEDTSVIYN